METHSEMLRAPVFVKVRGRRTKAGQSYTYRQNGVTARNRLNAILA